MYHFVPPTVMVAGGRCVWVTSAVLVDVRAHIVPLKSFLAPYLLLSRPGWPPINPQIGLIAIFADAQSINR
jgi:hypothetical protein